MKIHKFVLLTIVGVLLMAASAFLADAAHAVPRPGESSGGAEAIGGKP